MQITNENRSAPSQVACTDPKSINLSQGKKVKEITESSDVD
jgi:hypothetical protein